MRCPARACAQALQTAAAASTSVAFRPAGQHPRVLGTRTGSPSRRILKVRLWQARQASGGLLDSSSSSGGGSSGSRSSSSSSSSSALKVLVLQAAGDVGQHVLVAAVAQDLPHRRLQVHSAHGVLLLRTALLPGPLPLASRALLRSGCCGCWCPHRAPDAAGRGREGSASRSFRAGGSVGGGGSGSGSGEVQRAGMPLNNSSGLAAVRSDREPRPARAPPQSAAGRAAPSRPSTEFPH